MLHNTAKNMFIQNMLQDPFKKKLRFIKAYFKTAYKYVTSKNMNLHLKFYDSRKMPTDIGNKISEPYYAHFFAFVFSIGT